MTHFLISAILGAIAMLPITPDQFRDAEKTIGNPESELYDEDAFCHILRSALDASILDEAAALRARYRLEIAAKNRPGSRAANFGILLRRQPGQNNIIETNLYDLSDNKPILLIFYDPDCDHCMQTIDRLKSQPQLSSRVDIIAIYAEDDRERWEETASLLPPEWTVGFATDPIQDDETYIFITSPSIYLLDSRCNVLLKDTSLEKVAEYMN